jgi:hypothetical protein
LEQVPENFGVGLSHTVFNPILLLVVLLVGALICFSSRNKALVALLITSILVPTDQVLVLGALHFPVLRILVVFGMARILWAKASGSTLFVGGLTGIDKTLILFSIFKIVNGMFLWRDSKQFIFQMGNLTDFAAYFLLRWLIRDQDDVRRAIRVVALVTIAMAALMTYERVTERNPVYALLGGARADMYGTLSDRADDHRLRATGSFAHPNLAGTFGAIVLPLFFGLYWKYKEDRKLAVAGILAASAIPLAASSSTAMLGFLAGLGALCLWPFRRRMRIIRWAIALTLISLHLAMKAPVWHLISRIDLTGNSSSYHRFELVNQCILHFSEWWLIGTKNYSSWGFSMYDLGNQYVLVADMTGLLPLLLFLAAIVFGFRYLGQARIASQGDRAQELFLWALGAALFANVIAFFGIAYFDQTIVVWYAELAIISAATAGLTAPVSTPAEAQPSFQGWTGSSTAPVSRKERISAAVTLETHQLRSHLEGHPSRRQLNIGSTLAKRPL